MSLLLVVLVAGIIWQAVDRTKILVPNPVLDKQQVPEKAVGWSHEPFRSKGDDLIPLRGPVTLSFTSDFPRLDGEEPFFPMYASAVKMIYRVPVGDDRASIVDSMQYN